LISEFSVSEHPCAILEPHSSHTGTSKESASSPCSDQRFTIDFHLISHYFLVESHSMGELEWVMIELIMREFSGLGIENY
jgi:hypothetical protein